VSRHLLIHLIAARPCSLFSGPGPPLFLGCFFFIASEQRSPSTLPFLHSLFSHRSRKLRVLRGATVPPLAAHSPSAASGSFFCSICLQAQGFVPKSQLPFASGLATDPFQHVSRAVTSSNTCEFEETTPRPIRAFRSQSHPGLQRARPFGRPSQPGNSQSASLARPATCSSEG
jgi:hypothetical protein